MKICEQEHCTGCQACVSICSESAISMQPDKKGFYHPVVDEESCINCGLCIKSCPANVDYNNTNIIHNQTVVAAWNKNSQIRQNSSSGGVFSVIANYVLEKNGVIFGARWTDNWTVSHAYCEKKEDLAVFHGSKYLQSDVGESYKKAESFLENGRLVLFSGTPCQIAGLKSYLKKTYSNLLTVDLVCHGVPSSKVWRDYATYMEGKYNDKITNVKFRYKEPSWLSSSVKISFEKSNPYLGSVFIDPYFVGFVKNFYLRDSCYKCKFSNTNRHGDITLADFWGYEPSSFKYVSYDKGVSLVILNNNYGISVFNNISKDLVFEKSTIEKAIRGNLNLREPQKRPNGSDNFWNEYLETGDFISANKKHIKPDVAKSKSIIDRLRKYKFILPQWIIRLIQNIRKTTK